MNYHVYTSLKETRAQAACEYLICDVNTESEAITKLYESVQKGLMPSYRLGKYSIPDYTCGVRF